MLIFISFIVLQTYVEWLITCFFLFFRYADAVILNLEETHGESTTKVPMICLLSQGSDPTDQISTLAKKKNLECRAISMGQGDVVIFYLIIQCSCKLAFHFVLTTFMLGKQSISDDNIALVLH